MAKKFDIVLETALSRYTNNAGFLVGDYVKFKKNFKSLPFYQTAGVNVKELIDKIASEDKHIRVRGISNIMPSRAPGNTENMNGMVSITIAVDEGGGREHTYVTVCHSMLDPVELDGANLPKLPDSMNYEREKEASSGKPEEAKEVEARKGDKSAGKRSLPDKNIKLSNTSSAPNPTKIYLAGF
jgi:hypothetical protein